MSSVSFATTLDVQAMTRKITHFFVVILFAVVVVVGSKGSAADESVLTAPSLRPAPQALLFDDRVLADNVANVRKDAGQLSEAARYQYLAKWVLPSESHSTFRLNGVFTQTDPAPVNQAGTSPDEIRGGILVSPVFELLELAKKTSRLSELLNAVIAIPEPQREEQRRARAAMLIMIHMEMGQQEDAGKEADVLLRLVTQSLPAKIDDMWPETLVVYRGIVHCAANAVVEHLLDYLFTQRSQRDTPQGLRAWHNQIASLAGRSGHLETMRREKAPVQSIDLSQWLPVRRVRASTRGPGLPQAGWAQQGDRVDKISGHDEDYLFFRSPLTGDYEMECDMSHTTCQAMVAGTFVGSDGSQTQIWSGTMRDGAKQQPIDVKFSGFQPWVRYRCVVRGNVATTYLNGLAVRTEQLTSPDPWIAVRSWCRSHASARDVRIAGKPVVPESIDLSASSDLRGWYPYYDETAGTVGARWEHLQDKESTGEIFGHANAPQGTFFESLLTYQRPLEEIGSVSYQFLYKEGVAETHPALDRMAFILRPDGVRVHWITDGLWDSSEVQPDNLTDDPANRRGPSTLPLKSDEWNRMSIAVKGATVSLTLNGTLIYEGSIDINNRRTFGLFHYADQSEVRVRNVTMQGNWPKTVPLLEEQELAHRVAVKLDSDLPRLTAVFRHDFGKGGFPDKYFATEAAERQTQFTQRQDGVFINMQGKGNWIDRTIRVPFAIHGDFDLEVSFDQLNVHSEIDACAFMEMDFDDELQQQVRINRIRTGTGLHQLHTSMSIVHKGGGRSFAGRDPTATETTSGRLRLARRGTDLHYLLAENDSDNFRCVTTEIVTDKASRSDALVLHAVCHGTGETQVLWKSITLRAEQLTLKPGPDDRPAVNLYSMNPDGTNLRKLASPAKGFTQISSVEWSADGTQLIGAMSDGKLEKSRVVAMNADGSNLQDLGPGSMPCLSPDNVEIVFSQPAVGIIKMKADGSGRTLLDAKGWGPQWSPEGHRIAWSFGNNVVLLDLQTNKRSKLLTNPQSALFSYVYGNLQWSPDGKSLVFKARSSDRTNSFVVVADADTADGFELLYSEPDRIMDDITWHPDNKRVVIAVTDQTTSLSRLIMVNRDSTTPPESLTGPPADWTILGSDWSPDGQQIIFSAHEPLGAVNWKQASE